MTLSTFLQLLVDVDAERAAKGLGGLMRLRPSPLPKGRAPLPATDIETLLRYAQAATAAYGPMCNAIFFPAQHSSVKKKLGEHGIMILSAAPASTWLRPAYFLAEDRERGCLILSIRGTLCAEDVLTNLSAEEIHTDFGPVHGGMLFAARAVLHEVLPALEKELDQSGLKELVVVGHSLGAGVATYATLLLDQARIPGGPEVSVKCYSYGGPGVVRSSATESSCTNIVSVVNGYDWIPRLSYGHVVSLLERGHNEWDDIARRVEALVGALAPLEQASPPGAPPPPPGAPLRGPAAKAQRAGKPLPPKLYPCGKVVLLISEESNGPTKAVQGDQMDLEELELHPSMFMEHMPSSYERALRAALDGARGGTANRSQL